MKIDLTNRTAIVTGGAQGIGKAVARVLAGAGANIVIADIKVDQAKENPADSGRPATLAVPTDVSSEASVRELFAATLRHLGSVDIVVNCAGILRVTPILEIDAAEWDAVLAVNLRGTFLVAREAFRHMKERRSGKIVNIASVAGKAASLASGAHYSASKAGVIGLTRSLAIQAAPFKINVNAVAPGPIETEMISVWDAKVKEKLVERIPLKEFGTPEDVAYAVAFLVSDQARYLTGEIIDVNGGSLMD